MDSPLVFFSFVRLEGADAHRHRLYNEWHQLDHRPENLALPGVAWGDRWALPAEYRDDPSSTADMRYAATDYVAMYWFRPPVADSVREWEQLGADSFEWGRGPLIPGVHRDLLAFFRPVKGYVAQSSLVSPDVLKYRPNRGVHVTLTAFDEPRGHAAHEAHRFDDRVLMPALMDTPGVAGAWTFAFEHHQHNTLSGRKGEPDPAPGALRLRLLYLDDDPLAVAHRIGKVSDELTSPRSAATNGAGHVVFSAPLRTIVAWQDW